jgi:hypothetical protein
MASVIRIQDASGFKDSNPEFSLGSNKTIGGLLRAVGDIRVGARDTLGLCLAFLLFSTVGRVEGEDHQAEI